MKKLLVMSSLVILGLMLVALPSSAVLLPPGSTVLGPGDALTGPVGGPYVADTGIKTWVNGTGTMSGLYRELVAADPARGGQLDFFIQLSIDSTSTDSIARISTASFTGFLTDVGFNTCCGGTMADEVTRSLSGSVVGWNFNAVPGDQGILPGSVSAVLEIDTNAYGFINGVISVIDGGTTDLHGFAPTAVPEPASLMLFGSGLVGLGNFLRKKFIS